MAKATREAFGEALVRVGKDPRVVVLDGDLMKSNFTYLFKEAYPERFFEVGIAESNMVGVAAGLALSGKIAFASSFACFLAGRLEVIRMSVGYNEANVRLAGTHAGVGIGDDGASQMALEDVAAMRALPADYRFEFGTAVVLREGSDVALVATGGTVQEAMRAADALGGDGISARVVNVHTIKPIDKQTILEAAGECGHVITVEDHNVAGGLGSAVAEVMAEAGIDARLTALGTKDYGQSGSPEELYDEYGLSAPHIENAVRKALKVV